MFLEKWESQERQKKTSRQRSIVPICKIVSHFAARNVVVEHEKRTELKILI